MKAEKNKILEICPFSAGICGVWARALAESREFVRLGYEVRVFSSDIEKGGQILAKCDEEMEGISIKRFRGRSSIISKNVNLFDFEEEFDRYNPNIVITHLLHPHSFKALELCKERGIPCYLVTHAPFNVERKFPLNLVTSAYSAIKIKPKLNDFTKIIAVTRWELPYLLKYGARKDKIVYIPNGLPREFFRQKKAKKTKQSVLFLGRISSVKYLESMLIAAKALPNINFKIIGSAEREYLSKIEKIIEKNGLKNVSILPPIYGLERKIAAIDRCDIFVLPSKREAMPQVLLEAMARGKIVISSATDGGREIVKQGISGFIFKIGDSKKLVELIRDNIKGNSKIQKMAEREARNYAWEKLIQKYLKLFGERKVR